MFKKLFKKKKKDKRPRGAVGVMVFKNGKILMGKRRDTATHGAGEYSFPGGKIELGESFFKALTRETLEEAGVNIKNIKFSCVTNMEKHKGHHYVLVNFTAEWESGEPRSLFNEKIGEWNWFDLENLPSPLFYPTEVLIDSYKSGKNYYDKE
ncbi:MAG: NUDIX domain-containing protein [Patescibacteria group bacterium]